MEVLLFNVFTFVLAFSGLMNPTLGTALNILLKLFSLFTNSIWKNFFSSFKKIRFVLTFQRRINDKKIRNKITCIFLNKSSFSCNAFFNCSIVSKSSSLGGLFMYLSCKSRNLFKRVENITFFFDSTNLIKNLNSFLLSFSLNEFCFENLLCLFKVIY